MANAATALFVGAVLVAAAKAEPARADENDALFKFTLEHGFGPNQRSGSFSHRQPLAR